MGTLTRAPRAHTGTLSSTLAVAKNGSVPTPAVSMDGAEAVHRPPRGTAGRREDGESQG